jgi:hypothetical protein
MVFHKLPCSILSLDVQDIMGSHSVNVEGTLVKNNVDKKGNIIGKFEESDKFAKNSAPLGGSNNNIVQPDIDKVRGGLKREEGCQIFGSISILKVPGNFHISSHAFAQTIGKLASEGAYNFDLTHTVNHISFGNEDDIRNIKKIFNTGILNPLDNTNKTMKSYKKVIYEYYLNVIPTTYIDLQGKEYNVHQFTANSNEVKAQMMIPAIFFRYDLNPILIKYTQTRERIFQFFIEICAIIGGIYMVTSFILTFIINSSALFFKDKEK